MRQFDQVKAADTNIVTILSWNVNGIRAVYRKGFLRWLADVRPNVMCLQETRARSSQLSGDLAQPADYHVYWNSSTRLGYSGTALLSRDKPLCVEFGLGQAEFDQEGRTIIAQYPDFTLVNCYFPNGNRDDGRLLFKLDFCDALLAKCERLRTQGHTVLFCGDLNTAHQETDLSHPESNRGKSGFLPEERRWIDKVIKAGYVDSFRHFHPDLIEQFTWWSYIANSRERNVGWRFDYLFVAEEAMERVKDAFIMSDVSYSDHCPVGIRLTISDRE